MDKTNFYWIQIQRVKNEIKQLYNSNNNITVIRREDQYSLILSENKGLIAFVFDIYNISDDDKIPMTVIEIKTQIEKTYLVPVSEYIQNAVPQNEVDFYDRYIKRYIADCNNQPCNDSK